VELRRPVRASVAAITASLAGLAALAAGCASPSGQATGTADRRAGGQPQVSVIVRAEPGGESAAAAAVRAAGGRITRGLGIIDSHAAMLPPSAVGRLAAHPAVATVTPDAPLRLLHSQDAGTADGPASLFHLADTVQARPVWAAGYTGAGVDVAVVDSGVVPVNGLVGAGKVVNGPDLSFESGEDQLRHLDTYGHGTHLAGIIAGRDDEVATPFRGAGHDRFVGIAPEARIVNLKVADSAGATDVSQVIAAVDWVVEHRRDNGLNIRVLNLSFGTDGVQTYQLDPLAHAVEQAWHRGVVVVVAAGNDGYGDDQLNNPAYDPYVLAVGGSDGRGTTEPGDDVVAPWSSRGGAGRHPDLVAPGQSVVSLRNPGSRIDRDHPGARVGERLFRGSGTSQAAAVVSGAVALLLQQRPDLTPDQVKALLQSSARPLPQADPAGQGAGVLDVRAAAAAPTPKATQTWPRSIGTGSLELARGTARVTVNGVEVTGERSVFFTAWNAVGWVGGLLATGTWSGGGWTGNSWTGNSWTGGSWRGNSWTGNSWTGNSWTGNSWTGNSWSSADW
jgi:subtilisin family serine protease